jgi:hypothetical protein
MNAVPILTLALLLQNVPAALSGLPAGTASLEGVVTMQVAGPLAPTGPVQPNMVAQYATPNPPYTATSGADGKYSFRNIAAGNYKLVAARIGGSLTPVELGLRGALGRGVVFPFGNGEQKKNVRMEMAPVGSIRGRILDVDNRPVGHAGGWRLLLSTGMASALSPCWSLSIPMIMASIGSSHLLQAGTTSQLGWKT